METWPWLRTWFWGGGGVQGAQHGSLRAHASMHVVYDVYTGRPTTLGELTSIPVNQPTIQPTQKLTDERADQLHHRSWIQSLAHMLTLMKTYPSYCASPTSHLPTNQQNNELHTGL